MQKMLTRIDEVLKRMGEVLRIRGYGSKTEKAYVCRARGFLDFTRFPIDQIDQDHAHRYLVHLKDVRKLSGSTINQTLFAIRFLFTQVMQRPWDSGRFRCHKRRRKLPVALSLEEIFRILAEIDNLKHRTMIMTAYSAGLRVSELTHLKCRDIDSNAMRILVHGKGEKDRYVMLSPRLVEDLRKYWHAYHPGVWLFPGQNRSQPVGPKTIQRVFKRARDAAGVDKPATPHSLRHSFAVHLLEAGVNLKYIQELLGHSSIQSTLIYLKLAPECARAVRSPLDQLPPLPPPRRY